MSEETRPIPELGEFILSQKRFIPEAIRNEIIPVFTAFKLAAKVITLELSHSNTWDMTSDFHQEPVVSVATQKLHEAFKNRCVVAGFATSEDDEFVQVDAALDKNLVAVVHPLDNFKGDGVEADTHTNVSAGTTLALYQRVSPVGGPVTAEDFLQKGDQMVAAAYVVYGSSTILVMTLGKQAGVHGFTLDGGLGVFYLSHRDIRIPPTTSAAPFSVDLGKRRHFSKELLAFVDDCQAKGRGLRYIGSVVADVHRNLLKGGLFLYPPTFTEKRPSVYLVFQCIPLAFLIENAGGEASTGDSRILGLEPENLDSRCSFFAGSSDLVGGVKAAVMQKA
uniref:fructose-bisphosphatase n=2 Tax=Chromera velia TaxID=505693 RepID=X2D9U1_9ALVE|nr:cytosolic fructose-1,6-bisphosphatase [Chromera velia]|mmetsp:Transcript_31562/g.62423  ORF Transcript_31562/g.62423 Transcript_31562/m.62423 type:complete len:335 (+) Transcript_31562:219-1223(+)|eukprot:Cvel_16838.t1-p1 / transcript=Cvel_16838.t1 / gene=Cvel_16838 / organism=Chromera_velia_CCMP2878 / gene_product=Fructose-1,6-bisphosphatase class 1, putative / transcript_product=Fructose-1,6-bisphosphatase class 1, putative / location=Cvel_scaffold1316:34015-38058(-) / protein_length=334 / sequence_SO=supercontig / SO=protein_coding / is_pseudo=false